MFSMQQSNDLAVVVASHTVGIGFEFSITWLHGYAVNSVFYSTLPGQFFFLWWLIGTGLYPAISVFLLPILTALHVQVNSFDPIPHSINSS